MGNKLSSSNGLSSTGLKLVVNFIVGENTEISNYGVTKLESECSTKRKVLKFW